MKSYQAAILRFRYDAGAGECLNIGLLLFAPKEKLLLFRVNNHCGRLKKAFPNICEREYSALLRQLDARYEVCLERLTNSTENLQLHTLMHTIASPDASVLQWSEVYAGICADTAHRFDEVYAEMVTRWDQRTVWSQVQETLGNCMNLISEVRECVARARAKYQFDLDSFLAILEQVAEGLQDSFLEAQVHKVDSTEWHSYLKRAELTIAPRNKPLSARSIVRISTSKGRVFAETDPPNSQFRIRSPNALARRIRMHVATPEFIALLNSLTEEAKQLEPAVVTSALSEAKTSQQFCSDDATDGEFREPSLQQLRVRHSLRNWWQAADDPHHSD